MTPRDEGGTKLRILRIAEQLFAKHGYNGTSIADIASELGTSKAALYYHFPAKEDILSALMAEPVAEYAALAERADAGGIDRKALLGRLVDMTAAAGTVQSILLGDLSLATALPQFGQLQEHTRRLIAALAGPGAGPAETVRGYAAFAVVKQGTLLTLRDQHGRLGSTARNELIDAALRALSTEVVGGHRGLN